MPIRLGVWDIALIIVIILIIFGAGRIPQIGSAFSKVIRELKTVTEDVLKRAVNRPSTKSR